MFYFACMLLLPVHCRKALSPKIKKLHIKMKIEAKVRKNRIEFYSFPFFYQYILFLLIKKTIFFCFLLYCRFLFSIEICEIIMKKKWKSYFNRFFATRSVATPNNTEKKKITLGTEKLRNQKKNVEKFITGFFIFGGICFSFNCHNLCKVSQFFWIVSPFSAISDDLCL